MTLSSLFLITFIAILQFQNQMIYSCDHNATCGCSNNSPLNSKIVGGQNAKTRTWGWIVSLRVRSRFYCAGSILSNLWIVTAAHCFSVADDLGTNLFRVDPSEITVHAASINQHEESQVRRVTKIIFHPKFDESNFLNDIALLRLSSSLHITDDSLAKICLPSASRNDYPPIDSLLVAIGWGRVWEDGPQSAILQQIVIKTVDYRDSSCLSLIFDQSKQFCAGVENSKKDTCQGDSGGPLMVYTSSQQWVLVGVTSFGHGCAQPGYAGVYTRIGAYADWINSFVKDINSSMYPYSLIPKTPYEDDDLEWDISLSLRRSMSVYFSTVISATLFVITRYSLN